MFYVVRASLHLEIYVFIYLHEIGKQGLRPQEIRIGPNSRYVV